MAEADAIQLTLIVSGSLEDYGEQERTAIAREIARVASVPIGAVTVEFSSASVRITATIAISGEDSSTRSLPEVRESLEATFGKTESATSTLQKVVPTIVVESTPAIKPVKEMESEKAPQETGSIMPPQLLMYGVGAGFLILLLGGLLFCWCRRHMTKRTAGHILFHHDNSESGARWRAANQDSRRCGGQCTSHV